VRRLRSSHSSLRFGPIADQAVAPLVGTGRQSTPPRRDGLTGGRAPVVRLLFRAATIGVRTPCTGRGANAGARAAQTARQQDGSRRAGSFVGRRSAARSPLLAFKRPAVDSCRWAGRTSAAPPPRSGDGEQARGPGRRAWCAP